VSVVVMVVLALAGCSAPAEEPAARGRAPSPTVAPAPTPAGAPSPTPLAFPQSCAELVPTAAVLAAVARPLPGPPTYLYAGPLPDVGRTSRVTCGYGGGDPPAVEVSRIGYVDAATAAGRIDRTVADANAQGERVSPQPVAGGDGWVLAGPERTTLVTARDASTVVVSVRRGVVPATAVPSVLDEVATAVLQVG
jgi:hypothetical protein